VTGTLCRATLGILTDDVREVHHMTGRVAPGLPTRLLWTAADAALWIASLVVATWMRLDFTISDIYVTPLLVGTVVVVAVHVTIGWIFGPYAVGHELGSFEETSEVARAAAVAGVVLAGLTLVLDVINLPRSVPLSGLAIAVTGMFAARFIIRSRRTYRAVTIDSTKRAVIFGAGSGGRILVQSLVRDPSNGIVPVALLDDDPLKSRLHFSGVRVRGTRDDLAAVAEKRRATTLVIAVPSATSETVRELSALARDSGLDVLVLPPVRDLFNGRPTASDLRNLDVADLLGRQPVHLDMATIADQIGGKRVLVTGAGGSIGSELCRQLSKFGPSHLLMLDRDESGLHATQMSVEGRALLDSDDLLLCDIRDIEALNAAFERSRPEVVFHAAALKHLTMLERNPSEAFKTNVLGTRNVLEAARAVGVETFVNISTDKAARPTCVLGWSKRVAERLTAGFDGQGAGRYISVRFGNVLGSRGSVVPAFLEQISRGGPVTVTHPDVERFFMLIPEACQLVLQAGAIGRGGEVMVLDMGSPVKIVEVARTLIELSGRTDIEIVYTGLRPGEKLTEELFTPGDEIERSSHPLISQVHVPALDARQVDLHEGLKDIEIREWMHRRGGATLSSIAS
jgi:FlaA1/EpsC-like NDP-sugar epimerase